MDRLIRNESPRTNAPPSRSAPDAAQPLAPPPANRGAENSFGPHAPSGACRSVGGIGRGPCAAAVSARDRDVGPALPSRTAPARSHVATGCRRAARARSFTDGDCRRASQPSGRQSGRPGGSGGTAAPRAPARNGQARGRDGRSRPACAATHSARRLATVRSTGGLPPVFPGSRLQPATRRRQRDCAGLSRCYRIHSSATELGHLYAKS